MPNIAFDLRTTHLTGIHRYGINILKNLIPILEKSDFNVSVLHRPNFSELDIAQFQHQPLGNVSFVSVFDDYQFLRDSKWLRDWLIENEINLLYSPHYSVDVNCPVKYLYTIHDLLRLKYPAYSYDDNSFLKKFGTKEFERLRQISKQIEGSSVSSNRSSHNETVFQGYFKRLNFHLSQNSVGILTASETVKDDVARILGVAATKIFVIPGAVDTDVFYNKKNVEILFALEKFNLSRNYCLYVGLNHPHKRLTYLIDIIAEKRDSIPENSQLVIVAPYQDMFQEISDSISIRGLSDFVKVLFAVSDEDLTSLYSGAKAVIVPSLEEGFCLPALESLACKTEVIVPDIKSLRETVKAAGHFYPLYNREVLGDLVVSAFNNKLGRKASTFRNDFSWSKSAQKLYNLFQIFAA